MWPTLITTNLMIHNLPTPLTPWLCDRPGPLGYTRPVILPDPFLFPSGQSLSSALRSLQRKRSQFFLFDFCLICCLVENFVDLPLLNKFEKFENKKREERSITAPSFKSDLGGVSRATELVILLHHISSQISFPIFLFLLSLFHFFPSKTTFSSQTLGELLIATMLDF